MGPLYSGSTQISGSRRNGSGLAVPSWVTGPPSGGAQQSGGFFGNFRISKAADSNQVVDAGSMGPSLLPRYGAHRPSGWRSQDTRQHHPSQSSGQTHLQDAMGFSTFQLLSVATVWSFYVVVGYLLAFLVWPSILRERTIPLGPLLPNSKLSLRQQVDKGFSPTLDQSGIVLQPQQQLGTAVSDAVPKSGMGSAVGFTDSQPTFVKTAPEMQGVQGQAGEGRAEDAKVAAEQAQQGQQHQQELKQQPEQQHQVHQP